MAKKKKQTYLVTCPNCQEEVEVYSQDSWDKLVKYYIPACPKCSHSFAMHIRNRQDLCNYIGYKVSFYTDDIPDEDIPNISFVKEDEW